MKTLFYETSEALYNDVWVTDWVTTDHEAIRVGCYGTSPVHRLARRGRASDLSITLAAIVCVVAAQRRLAALGKKNSSRRRDESDERITSVFFSDYDRREQLLLRESERSLLVQRLALRSSQGRAALLLITQPGVDHSSPYRGVQIRVLF